MRSAQVITSLIVFTLLLTVLALQVSASSNPVITIAANPVNYGQNDKITAQPSSVFSTVLLYINKTLVAGPKAASVSVNYTVCKSAACLTPGVYVINAYDNSTSGVSSVENLVINPVSPTFTVQAGSIKYGNADKITASPAFYNDSISILINGSSVYTGRGDIVYYVCKNASDPCITPGTHRINVIDTTEGVSSSNEIITVEPVQPSITVQYPNVKYGDLDTISATAPFNTDPITIYFNSTAIFSATGNVSYKMCSSSEYSCVSPSTYSVYVRDTFEDVNSSAHQLTITPTAPQLSVSSQELVYGTSEKLVAKAPNSNDMITIYINGVQVATGTGSANYTICSLPPNTKCMPVGTYTVSAYDTMEKRYAPNASFTVKPVLPNMVISAASVNYGIPDTIHGTSPVYNDQLDIFVNGSNVATGTGTVSYTICSSVSSASCLAPGTYKVLLDDISEGVNSTPVKITVLPNANISSTILTTSVISATTTAANTSSSSPIKVSGTDLTYIGVVIAAIIVIIIVRLLLSRRGGNVQSGQ